MEPVDLMRLNFKTLKHNPTKTFLFQQEMALVNEENLPMFNRCGVMALVAAYLNFLSQMIASPPLCQHVSKVSPGPDVHPDARSDVQLVLWLTHKVCDSPR